MRTFTAPRASQEERERLLEDFVRLCGIESPSRRERRVADFVSAELRGLGIDVQEDESRAATGSDSGNLLARVAGPPDARTILLCAHLDTVPLAAPIDVVVEGGLVENRNDAIVGADNKAAVAVILALARRLVSEPPPVGIELLFTTCEEEALAGAKAFDTRALAAEYGFVFDHASPIGELIVAAPSYYRVEGRFHGRAAHAGLRPEDGRNAIAAAAGAVSALSLGRLDDETTSNVGRIEGGTAPNVVAERCRLELEARSLDPAKVAATVTGIVDALTEAAGDAECDVETVVEEKFRAYRLARTAAPVAVAAAALEGLGIEPRYVATAAGSDASALQAAGLACVNIADGTEGNHQPDERITVAALETMLDLGLGLVALSA